MALNPSSLTAAIKAGLLSLPVVGDSESRTYGDVMTDAQKDAMEANIGVYADDILNHIIENAEVTVVMANHTHLGVTSGGGVSGLPVTPITEDGTIS